MFILYFLYIYFKDGRLLCIFPIFLFYFIKSFLNNPELSLGVNEITFINIY